MPAVESRIKTGVLVVAGLLYQRALPEVDQIHFLPRVEIPMLMLNGKYDFFFPYETSQLPFYELLGTPIWVQLTNKFNSGRSAKLKRVRQWLEENDML